MNSSDIFALIIERRSDLMSLYELGLNKFLLPNYIKSSIRTCEAQILYAIIQEKKYARILDIGTGRGFSAAYFARALKDGNINGYVDTIDTQKQEGDPLEAFRLFGVDDLIRVHTGDSVNLIPTLGDYDFILIDSLHTYSQTLKEYNLCIDKLQKGGCLAFHDTFSAPPSYADKGPRGVIEDVIEDNYAFTYFSEEMFDLFSYEDDLSEIKRMQDKWKKTNYIYADRSANPKEIMGVMFKS